MENFDKRWNYVDSKNVAVYTNIPPGKYVFKVRSKIVREHGHHRF